MTEHDLTTPQLPRLTVYRQPESLGAAEDLDFALELLQRARSGRLGPSLRLYRPLPTVAFGQRDANLPGFEAAGDACRRLGFEPLVRKAGGRAAVTTMAWSPRLCARPLPAPWQA